MVQLKLRRNCTILAVILLVVDCVGLIFPAVRLNEDRDLIHTSSRMLAEAKGQASQRAAYKPPREVLIPGLFVALCMAFDFLLLMGCALKSTRMLLVWMALSPVRVLLCLVCAIWQFVYETPERFALGICFGLYFLIVAAIVMWGAVLASRLWTFLHNSKELRVRREEQRRMAELAFLRDTATEASRRSIYTKHQRHLEEEALAEVASAEDVYYVAAQPRTHTYAYRHWRDRTRYASHISY